MNIKEIETVFKVSGLIKNEHNFRRYIKLMNYFQDLKLIKPPDSSGLYEYHHILPRKIWREYKNCKWNIVLLPTKYHLLAHRLLYKCIKHASCVYAFNQMRRVALKHGKVTGKIYQMVRSDFVSLISKNNLGRTMNASNRAAMSERCSGTNIYRNVITGELQRFIIGDEPSGWKSFQTGRVRTKQSKAILGKKMKGRIWQYNLETKDVKFVQTILEGYIAGVPPWFDNGSDVFAAYKWAYNEVTGEVIRCSEENIPKGFILGRKYDNIGFQMINNSNYEKVLDLETKSYTLVDKKILPNPRYIKHGSKIQDIFIIEYKNNTFYSWAEVEKTHPELPKYSGLRNQTLLDFVVPKKHFNQTKERQEFCVRYHGQTFRDIGISMRKLIED